MSEWQPIETAPKDGTDIDIWASFGSGGERYTNVSFLRGAWRVLGVNELDQTTYVEVDGTPTHWMLPPEPPK